MTPHRTIDLNADVGEAADAAGVEVERTLLGLVTSAHVACGGHAGDDDSMKATVAAAFEHAVGSAPIPPTPTAPASAVNRWTSTAAELGASLSRQVAALDRVCRAAGTTVQSVKAHGALYEEVAKGGAVYETFRDAVRDSVGEDADLVLPSGCRALAMVLRDGMTAREEGFCDRAYRRDGGLVDRSEAGAVLTDPASAAAQALTLARGAVVADDGSVLTLWVDTLCIHGDSPGAVAIATAVRAAMVDAGMQVRRAGTCMTPSVPVGQVRRLGDRAFLIGVADAAAARELAGDLMPALGDAEVVCGSATVMVHVTDPDADLSSLEAAADGARAQRARRGRSDDPVDPGRVVKVPCCFDGPDLEEVAALAGCRPDDVVSLLTAGPLTAAVMGFSPGFAYLEGLPSPLDRVPRRPRPRPVVPAGSVAIANGHAAVYPTASPGGWHLVGRTGFPLFSAQAPPYAALAPGDRVRFTVAGAGERVEPEPVVAPPWSLPPGARAVFEVVAPGLRAVVQDGGRRGVAAVGVPAAGPADPVSFDLANRLTGNVARAAALELTGGGSRLRCLDRCHVAVVGAAPEVRVDGTPVPAGQLLPLAAGQVLEVGRQHGGCRSYVSVAGGFLGPEWFGSCAGDELTGLGPGPLGGARRAACRSLDATAR